MELKDNREKKEIKAKFPLIIDGVKFHQQLGTHRLFAGNILKFILLAARELLQ